MYPAIPDTQERSLGSRLSDAHAERLWRLTPARSGAVESLRTPPRPRSRRVAPRSPVYVPIGDGGRARSARSRCIGHSLPVTLEEGTRRYVATLEQLAALGEPGTDTDAWNRAVEANQSSYRVLRQSREGRDLRDWDDLAHWSTQDPLLLLDHGADEPGPAYFARGDSYPRKGSWRTFLFHCCREAGTACRA